MTYMRLGISRCSFDEIRKRVNCGEDINQLTPDGISLFAAYLNNYYEEIMEEQEDVATPIDEYDRSGSLLKYQLTSTEKRKIIGELQWFIDNGVDFNLVDAENDNCDTPLSIAEWYEDYYMMKFLLKNGADPKVWYTPENERFYGHDFEIELIHSLDCAMLDCSGSVLRNQKRMLWLLMDYGMPVSGVYRYIFEAEEEYIKWKEMIPKKDIEFMEQDEIFSLLYKLSARDIVDYEYMKNLLDKFVPWDREHSYEALFAQAFYGRNVDLFELLYKYCEHPDYTSDYMNCDVLFDSQYIDNYPCSKMEDELSEQERIDAIEDGIDKVHMAHILLTHPDAVEEYKYRTGSDEPMMSYITYKLNHFDEETPLGIMQLKRIFIELTAFHVYDDFGPKILKEFEVDRLDDYYMTLFGKDGAWEIYNYKGDLMASF